MWVKITTLWSKDTSVDREAALHHPSFWPPSAVDSVAFCYLNVCHYCPNIYSMIFPKASHYPAHTKTNSLMAECSDGDSGLIHHCGRPSPPRQPHLPHMLQPWTLNLETKNLNNQITNWFKWGQSGLFCASTITESTKYCKYFKDMAAPTSRSLLLTCDLTWMGHRGSSFRRCHVFHAGH